MRCERKKYFSADTCGFHFHIESRAMRVLSALVFLLVDQPCRVTGRVSARYLGGHRQGNRSRLTNPCKAPKRNYVNGARHHQGETKTKNNRQQHACEPPNYREEAIKCPRPSNSPSWLVL